VVFGEVGMLQLNQLAQFLSIARTGSLAAAAVELNVSPAALSKSLASLEKQLGARLFDRVGRGLQLTPAGEVFSGETAELLGHADAVATRFQATAGGAAGCVTIGCGVTHSRIIRHPLIRAHGACLAESCGVIGGPQVRNVGTLAGNVAHALPAGDGTIGLLALDGEAEVASADGTRWVPVRDTFVGPGRSVINRHQEVLTRLRFRPTGDREGSAHHRVMRPQGLCLPIVSMAARLKLDAAGRIAAATVSMGPVGPVPWIAEPAMQLIVGESPSPELFAAAADAVLGEVSLRTSKYRATSEYRRQMIRTWLPVILGLAASRAEDAR
jgi:carbon-monoxide dehydrogenase medium subunit